MSRRPLKQSGSAAVEFALVLPLLLLVVCGAIDFGRFLNAQVTLSAAARERARWTALSQPNPTGRVLSAASGVTPAPTVTVVGCSVPPAAGQNATVRARSVMPTLTPLGALSALFGGALPATVTVTSTAVMRCGG